MRFNITTNSVNNFIKNLNLFLPLLGGYFILYGIISIVGYYSEFNLSIIDYVGFSEIITFFIKDLFEIVTMVFAMIILIMIFSTIDKKSYKEILEERKSKFIPISIRNKRIILKTVTYIVINIIIISTIYFLEKEYLFSYKYIPILIMVSMIFFVRANIVRELLILSSFILYIGYDISKIKAQKIIEDGMTGFNFKINNKIIESDSINFYIGKTEKYLFYYKSKEKETIVYPIDKVEFIKIPINED